MPVVSGEPDVNRMVHVTFEVRVPGVCEKDAVRISGSARALGEWNISRSVSLARHKESIEVVDVWKAQIELPPNTNVEYRYFVLKYYNSVHGTVSNVAHWETSKHPRKFYHLAINGNEELDSYVSQDDGYFGVCEAGGGGSERGWLMELSELQLQLHCSEENPIRIDTMPPDTQYSVKLQTIIYCAETGSSSKDFVCHPPITLKVLDRRAGECEVVEQSEHGHPYREEHMLVYSTQAPTFTYCGFLVEVYALPGEGCQPEYVGLSSILPYQLEGDAGRLSLTVFSNQLQPVGCIRVSYLLIHPVKECPFLHSVKHSRVNYWRKHKRALDIGHRGLGDSYIPNDTLKPSVVENTIGSLKEAGEHGADYVEFDVQLTKDLVPVVYHDFHVCTTLAKTGFSRGELYEMHVKELTLHQLHSLRLEHTSVLDQQGKDVTFQLWDRRTGSFGSSASLDTADCTCVSDAVGIFSVGLSEEELTLRTFPTLEEAFKAVPPHTGFNIEIKYPVPEQGHDKYNFDYFGRNLMADIILRTVYQHAHHRKIMFSCFDADMCTVIRRKQPRYPVMFLSTVLSPEFGDPVDIRAQSLHEAMMHARAENLLGINVNSTPLLARPELIRSILSKELVLFTWGSLNNEPTNIDLQKKLGVDAVIYDRINYLLPRRRSIFEVEKEQK